MLRIYVAGAYSSHDTMEVWANMRRGIQLSIQVVKAGFAPFTPWFDFLFPIMAEDITLKELQEYSLAWLEKSDALLVVPENVEASKGTQVEIQKAKELNIPVFWSLGELIEWSKKCSR